MLRVSSYSSDAARALSEKKLPDAVAALTKALQAFADLPIEERTAQAALREKMLEQRSDAYSALGKWQECVEDALDIIRHAPVNAAGYLRVGSILRVLKRYEDASAFVRRSLELQRSAKASVILRGIETDAAIASSAAAASGHAGGGGSTSSFDDPAKAAAAAAIVVPNPNSLYTGPIPSARSVASQLPPSLLATTSPAANVPSPAPAAVADKPSNLNATALPPSPIIGKPAATSSMRRKILAACLYPLVLIVGLVLLLLFGGFIGFLLAYVTVVVAHRVEQYEKGASSGSEVLGVARILGVPLSVYTAALLCFSLSAWINAPSSTVPSVVAADAGGSS